MNQLLTHTKSFKNLFSLKILPIIALITYCELDKMSSRRELNAAAVNISGRQRMLCQRTALFAMRLVYTQDASEQETLCQGMLAAIDLMERSHNALINGDAEMKLPGQPSETLRAIYFDEPLYLDRQIRDYMAHVRALARSLESSSAVPEGALTLKRSHPSELKQENPHLQAILKAAETELIEALDAVVNQYQKEIDAAALKIERQQTELYRQSCAAAAAAYVYAQQLEQTMQDLRCTQAQLIQTEKLSSIGQMIAGVAHEINNPVSFIYGNLRYASDYVQDLLDLLNLYQEYYSNPSPVVQAKIKDIDLDFLLQDLPKVLASMEVGADRVRQIVLSLRNFSRSDQILMQSMDLHEGIDSTLLILQNRLKARGNRSDH
jgi:two-component system NtrC family sensor kinase